jgi:hypothetical protein
MALENCQKCGKLFIRRFEPLCPACIKKRYVEVQSIKGWIVSKKDPHLSDLEADIGISPEVFIEHLQKERFKTRGKVKANCEHCGRIMTIKTRYLYCVLCMEILIGSDGGIHSHFYSREDDDN